MSSKLEQFIHVSSRRLQQWMRRWESQIASALLHDQYQITPEGVILFEDKRLVGRFFHRYPNLEKDFTCDKNLIVDQGIMKLLGIGFYTDAKINTWYLTMFSGSTTPANTLTAANFAATQAEITSTTEGFSNATRPAAVFAAPAANVAAIPLGSYATFNCVCTTSITATGAAVISDNTRGGTGGTLWSAAPFDSGPRPIYNAEPFQLGYQTSLTD